MVVQYIDVKEGEQELIKFFTLLKNENSSTTKNMPRCFVDTVWHKKIKDPDSYTKFCNDILGNSIFVEHSENNGIGKIEWVKDYEKLYGNLSPAWFSDEKGEVDIKAFEKYLESGDVFLEWDCRPIITTH